ncbi:ParM/StbA family protein [Leptospirillum ferriphilum]|uniref:ParM/StbA family protein n=1 Tax=Leptospirillum ferriphilum TaxID=178606 RepID=UPI0009845A19|nr:ParM/StbA family protein [Leptospirillum ferriphilum]OOH80879.1 hypothetical protein BOX30_05125 [Leptospirillum ferriphilum]
MSRKNEIATHDRDPDAVTDVGLDDGYAAVKLAWFDKAGAIRTLSVPSRAREGTLGIGAFGNDGMVGGYETEGRRFTISPGIEGTNTRFPDYNISALARVLSHHALILAGFAGKPVRLGSGLPLDRYFRDGKKNEDRINRKIESFAHPVTVLSGEEPVRIVRHEVFAQGLAAAVDWFYDGKTLKPQEGPVGIVDIGGQTTDLSVILPTLKTDHRQTTTCELGVLDVHEGLKRRILSVHNKVDDIPADALERALATGNIRLWGKDVPVHRECEEAVREVESQLENRIRAVFGKGISSLEALLFVGGGAKVFRGLPAAFPNAVLPEQPEFANARGLLKSLALSGVR